MDGNGRWAKQQGKPRLFGHLNSVKSVEYAIKGCAELNIPYLTLYAFSTENWQRPEEEVTGLMTLMAETINEKLAYLIENDIKLQVIGDIESVPASCKKLITDAIQATSDNNRLTLTICISYSGRWDIVQAVHSLVNDIQTQQIHVKDISEAFFAQYLSTSNIPDPDLVIRTGGDLRISNFLIWQVAYSELVIVKKYWPDFQEADFYQAVINYQKRNRRFGKVA
jgi:undecaprenyl diphosphate synthase